MRSGAGRVSRQRSRRKPKSLGKRADRDLVQLPSERYGSAFDQPAMDNHFLSCREHVAAESRLVAAATEAFEGQGLRFGIELDPNTVFVTTGSLGTLDGGREEPIGDLEATAQVDDLILEVERVGDKVCPGARCLAWLAPLERRDFRLALSMDHAVWGPRPGFVDDRVLTHPTRANPGWRGSAGRPSGRCAWRRRRGRGRAHADGKDALASRLCRGVTLRWRLATAAE